MTILSLLAFAATALLLAMTPGPGMAYVVARTVAGGRREGFASCLGTCVGGLVHVAASALGLSLLIAQSALAFNVVKYIGAAYLFYLGIRMLLHRVQHAEAGAVVARGAGRAFLEGVIVEAMNVKTALFFLALLPQFTSPNGSLPLQLAALGTFCVLMNTLVDVGAVLGADRLLQSSALRAKRARLMTRISGCTMMTLGAVLALTQRSG